MSAIYKEINENGYIILKDFYSKKDLQDIYDEINELGRYILDGDFDLNKPFLQKYKEKQREFYLSLRYLVSLKKFSIDAKNIDLCKELGLRHPCVMNACNIRMDTPENENLFHWHQDTTYLLGSLNALTFWIPLTKVDINTGTVEIVPKTHNQGFYDYKFSEPIELLKNKRNLSPKDVYLVNEPTENITSVTAEPGDLVVFFQMLLHRSTPTVGDKTRWAIQLRYSDLKNESFLNSGYPFGDLTNIINTKYTNE